MAPFIIVGEHELRELVRDLRKWESTAHVAETMEERLKMLGARDALIVKSAIRGIPSKHQDRLRGRRSLRAAMARATGWSYHRFGPNDTGVTVQVNPREMPPGQGGLPALMEGEGKWTHPTFGHRPIVTQAPHPYFLGIEAAAPRDAEQIGNHCVNTVANDVERG